MEEADTEPEEVSEPSVLSENHEDKPRGSTQEGELDPSTELSEEPWESRSQEEESEKLIPPQRISNLLRDSTTLVTNIKTAVDAKESMRRTELEEARRIRLERLENDIKSSQETFEEITRGWSTAKEKVIPQELQEALNHQQKLCAALIEDKKKLINDLQQELKVGDDRYVKDLRRHAEELDLMMERMDDQIKTLTKAYREELTQIERVYQQEGEVLLTRDRTDWEQHLKQLWDKEMERLVQRKKKVEEYEATIHNLMLETANKFIQLQTKEQTKFQVLEREHQRLKATNWAAEYKNKKLKDEIEEHRFTLIDMKNRTSSLKTEMKNLKAKYSSEKQQFTKKSWCLSEDRKRNEQRCKDMQKKIKLFAVADAREFKDMWLVVEAEVKQLVERALVIDSQICTQHLDLAWERPPMEFMELSGPIQPQKQAQQAASQRMMDLRLQTDSTDTEGTAVQSESGAEVEEGKLSMETLKKVMELLCDQAGFLMEDTLLNLLAPLEKEQQTVVKLGSLLSSLGIEEEDVPKLADFLLKYKHQQREQTEDVCVESEEDNSNSTTQMTPELIDPDHVVPALKSFLQQQTRSRASLTRQHRSFHVEARDASEDKAYWESMGNIISGDKLKLWAALKDKLKQHHAVLMEISELVPETQSLKQQNTELRMLLQQSLNSRVNTELETP